MDKCFAPTALISGLLNYTPESTNVGFLETEEAC